MTKARNLILISTVAVIVAASALSALWAAIQGKPNSSTGSSISKAVIRGDHFFNRRQFALRHSCQNHAR